jgi:hypothetical protein
MRVNNSFVSISLIYHFHTINGRTIITLSSFIFSNISLQAQSQSNEEKLTIILSNQSYELPKVDFIVTVNEDTLFNEILPVNDLHYYKAISIKPLTDLTTINIESIEGEAKLSFGYQHKKDTYIILNYWKDKNSIGYFSIYLLDYYPEFE